MSVVNRVSRSGGASAVPRPPGAGEFSSEDRPRLLGPVERLILIRDGFYAPDAATRRRAAVLLALDKGATVMAAARSARCNRSSVYRWLANYLERRDPAALGDNRRRAAGGPRQRDRRLLERAAALVALADARPEPADDGLGRLHLDRSGRRALWLLALDPAATPRLRYRAAMLRAVDLGLPTTTIARAVACDRQTVTNASRLHLHKTLSAAVASERRAAAGA